MTWFELLCLAEVGILTGLILVILTYKRPPIG